MSIRQAVTVFSFSVVIIIAVLLAVSSRYMLINSEEIERQQMKSEMLRGRADLTQQLSDFGSFVGDWAAWDDPYTFAQKYKQQFIDDNLAVESMKKANIDIALVINSSGKVVFSRAIDKQMSAEITVPATIFTWANTVGNHLVYSNNDDFRLGTLMDGDSAFMIAAYPLIGSNRMKSIGGMLIMGRRFNSKSTELGSDIFLKNSLSTFDKEIQKLPQVYQAMVRAGEVVVVPGTNDSVAVYQVVNDINNAPSVLMKIEQPRTIVKQSVKTQFSYGLVTISLLGIFAVLLFAASELVLSRPLILLQQQLAEMVKHSDFGKRVHMSGFKEYRNVSDGINRLMELNQRLAETASLGTRKMKEQLIQIETKNEEMEQTKLAMMNILEDERELEERLKDEKLSIEAKVVARTKDLEVEQAKLKGSIENLPVGFMMVSQQGGVVTTNKVIKEIFNNHSDEEQLNLIKTWVKNQKDVILDAVSQLPVSRSDVDNLSYHVKFLNISISPITIINEEKMPTRIGWVILVDDVTEERMIQKSRDEFFSIASHELRTPLTAIRGNTALIRDYYPQVMKDESLASIITDIHTASLRLIAIVNDFLDASRLELNKIQFKFETFDITTIAKKVVDTGKVMANEKKIECSLVVENDQPQMVNADQARVEQVLYNLVGNAIKFTKEGGVTVDIKSNDNKILVRVIDTGSGIAVENQGLLFRKFQQAGDNAFTREVSQGSGMGLYISSLLAVDMHGTVRLESSEVGKGSMFVFELPKS